MLRSTARSAGPDFWRLQALLHCAMLRAYRDE